MLQGNSAIPFVWYLNRISGHSFVTTQKHLHVVAKVYNSLGRQIF